VVDVYIPLRVGQGTDKTPFLTVFYRRDHDGVFASAFDVHLQDLVFEVRLCFAFDAGDVD
jgi:hypothetical protein